jgi:hypothetical protein
MDEDRNPPPQTKTLVTLADCPIGLFRSHGELCLKTEYGSNEGRIDAYIVSSGEFFWGGTNTPTAQRKVMVEPVSEIAVSSAPVSNLMGMEEEDRTPVPDGYDASTWQKADEVHHAMALVADDTECVKILYAALSKSPEGFALVPLKMTAAMINAWSGGLTVSSDANAYHTTFQDAWARVLGAALTTEGQP